jgi:uncharacterized protein YjbJ (UPF0337 family)
MSCSLAYMLAPGHSPHDVPGQARGGLDRGEAVPPRALPQRRRGTAPHHHTRPTARAAASMNERGRAMMGGEIDQIKRRIKKAAGVLADDDSLTSEGKVDRVVGEVKEKVVRVQGKLQQAVDQMRAAVAAKKASRWTK